MTSWYDYISFDFKDKFINEDEAAESTKKILERASAEIKENLGEASKKLFLGGFS